VELISISETVNAELGVKVFVKAALTGRFLAAALLDVVAFFVGAVFLAGAAFLVGTAFLASAAAFFAATFFAGAAFLGGAFLAGAFFAVAMIELSFWKLINHQ